MSLSRDALSRSRGRLRYRTQPGWIAPMLATLSDRSPTGGGWVYEPKLDGVRVLAYVMGGTVRLFSRNRRQVEGGYPELVEALSLAVRGDAVLDGEIVAPDPATGLSSFARLQQRMHLRDTVRAARTGVSVELYLFDCLFYEGIDLTGLPLLDRKKVLRDVVWYDGRIHFTPYRTQGSAAMYRDACARGAEGIIAKRAESTYVSGRSTDWLKIKCVLQQEFVIGGYTAPQGAREHLGALLVGYYDDEGALRYAGKVGTGYDQDTLELLRRRLAPLQRRTSPFAPGPVPAGEVQWVTPKLVAQIGFGEWTDAGLLRHPRYLGLRDDKPARSVRREEPKASGAVARRRGGS
ncbi:MAG TPA: non-homologous end-joining DNA ligase [Gemmatimonadales bacterium]|nr:non-homologous end-joining DNA ligase [Gemmatimonadales bacterium]